MDEVVNKLIIWIVENPLQFQNQ